MSDPKKTKNNTSLAVKKAMGTLNKVLEMIEKGEDCKGLVQQIDASIGLLRSARKKVIENKLKICLKDDPKTLQDLEDLYRIS